MKKISILIMLNVFLAPMVAMGAINVKKASSVSKQETTTMDSATSLLPTAISLVGGVKNLQNKTKQLNADCTPSSEDIRIVNDLVKEWAKIDDTDAKGAVYGISACADNDRSNGYAEFMRTADKGEECYELFAATSDMDKIWYEFPKASSTQVCSDNGNKKKQNCETVSNLYTILDKIPFSEADLTKSEASKVAQLKANAEQCAPAKVALAKAGLVSNFVMEALGSVGQKSGASGTEAVLQAVSSMGGNGNIQSMLPTLQQVGGQLLSK